MKKGSSGIRLGYLAALCFLFMMVDQILPCVLIMLYAVIVEKDEWLGRQSLQAVFLNVSITVVTWIITNLTAVVPMDWGGLVKALGIAMRVLDVGKFLILGLFGLIGAANVLRGREANIPVFSQIACKAYDMVPVQQTYAPQAAQPTAQPAAQPVQSPAVWQPAIQPQTPIIQPRAPLARDNNVAAAQTHSTAPTPQATISQYQRPQQ